MTRPPICSLQPWNQPKNQFKQCSKSKQNDAKKKSKHIRDYIESSDAIHLSNDYEASWDTSEIPALTEYPSFRESIGPLASGLYPATGEEFVNSYSPSSPYHFPDVDYLWKGLGKIMSFIPTFQGYSSHNDPEIGLNSSFVLIPGENIPVAGDRVVISSDISTAEHQELERLRAENQKLRMENRQLAQTNAQLLRCNVSVSGVKDLLQENTILKKSIVGFRQHMQKQPSLWAPSTMPPQQQIPLDSDAYSKRIIVLEETVRGLYQKLEAKDAEIATLRPYKEKWEKLKEDARRKKKERTGSEQGY